MKTPRIAEALRSDTAVTAGLRVLLGDVLDYAGMFPPASLPLDEAIKNFARYRFSRESWMLGRFVVPAERLSDLDAHVALFEQDPPFPFSVLAGRCDDAAKFLASLDSDLKFIEVFRRRHGDVVRIEALELRMPAAPLATDVVTVGRFISDIDAALEQYDLRSADLFCEIPLDPNCRQTATILAGALHALAQDRTVDEHGGAGIKMRTGGTKAEAFPKAENIASIIAACRDAGIPLKATAGLHHPVRHYDDVIGATMHGFLNVFIAAVLATAEHADEADLVLVLQEDDPAAFTFSDEGIEWRGHRAGVDVVARTRRDRAISFGSCSFAEPIDDLRSLGLL